MKQRDNKPMDTGRPRRTRKGNHVTFLNLYIDVSVCLGSCFNNKASLSLSVYTEPFQSLTCKHLFSNDLYRNTIFNSKEWILIFLFRKATNRYENVRYRVQNINSA